jgi:hypothetical protein
MEFLVDPVEGLFGGPNAEEDTGRVFFAGFALDIDGSLHGCKAGFRLEGDPRVQATGVALKRTIKTKLVLNLQHMSSCNMAEGGGTVEWMACLSSFDWATLNLRTAGSPSGPGRVTLTVISGSAGSMAGALIRGCAEG